jgi:hypothetical protein
VDSSPASLKLPWLYLDVDDVLNADDLAVHWPDAAPRKVRVRHGGGYAENFVLTLSREQGAALAAVPAAIVWCTSWDQHANRCISGPLGLPRNLPFLWGLHVDRGEHPGAWKPGQLVTHLRKDPRPFVWVDNDHPVIDTAWVLAAAAELDVPALLVTPDPKLGLTPDEIVRIADFCTSHVR